MADWQKIVDHVLKFEGAHSADPRDNALKYGNSGVKGSAINPQTRKPYDARFPNSFIHTNKGVIWSTYVNYCKQRKKTPTAAEFLAMPKSLWQDIMKSLFWDSIKGDLIQSQYIAEFLFEAQWGGGGSRLIRDLQRYINQVSRTKIPVSGVVTDQMAMAINRIFNTAKKQIPVIEYLTKARFEYLESLSDWNKYKNGWTRRLNTLKNRAISALKITAMWTSWFTFAAVGAGAFFF